MEQNGAPMPVCATRVHGNLAHPYILVVTGATDGIGREFALQLAKAGFGVVLVSRTQAKLDTLAEEICE